MRQMRDDAFVFPTRVLAVAALLVAFAAGCSDKPAPTARVAACVNPSASGQVRMEFRQDGKMIASGEIAPGGVFAAPVPATAAVDVYSDGKLQGSKDAGEGDVYLGGAGCPETAG